VVPAGLYRLGFFTPFFLTFQLPSPVQELTNPLFYERKLRVFIKRDDLIHPVISGNKWRKLKYVLEYAQHEGLIHLVTFGGAYSNHLLATACAGEILGFETTGFIRGEASKPLNDTLRKCAGYGMTLRYLTRENYRKTTSNNKVHSRSIDLPGNLANDLSGAYLMIPEGGSGPLGLQGCAEFAAELYAQDNVIYDHVVLALGTGTTAAGIANGFARLGLPTRVESIIVLKGPGNIKQEVRAWLEPNASLKFHPDYHFGGYAKSTPALLTFIEGFETAMGIKLEPVYTGKAYYALIDLVKKSYFKAGSRLLFVHTGGV